MNLLSTGRTVISKHRTLLLWNGNDRSSFQALIIKKEGSESTVDDERSPGHWRCSLPPSVFIKERERKAWRQYPSVSSVVSQEKQRTRHGWPRRTNNRSICISLLSVSLWWMLRLSPSSSLSERSFPSTELFSFEMEMTVHPLIHGTFNLITRRKGSVKLRLKVLHGCCWRICNWHFFPLDEWFSSQTTGSKEQTTAASVFLFFLHCCGCLWLILLFFVSLLFPALFRKIISYSMLEREVVSARRMNPVPGGEDDREFLSAIAWFSISLFSMAERKQLLTQSRSLGEPRFILFLFWEVAHQTTQQTTAASVFLFFLSLCDGCCGCPGL